MYTTIIDWPTVVIILLYTYVILVLTDDPCANLTCRSGSICTIDKPTGVAYCEESCINNGGCAANQTCFLDTLRCLNPPCPRIVRCLPSKYITNYVCNVFIR